MALISLLACENSQEQQQKLRAEATEIHEEGLKKLQAGNLDDAISLFDEAIAKDKTFADPHTNKVEVYLNQSAYEKAIDEIDIVLKKAPQVAENWVLAGIFEEKKGNKEKAFEYYEKSILKFEDRIEKNKTEETSDEFEYANADDEIGILFSYILLEDFDRLDKAITDFEDKNPGSPIIESLLEFNKDVYMENLFADFESEK